MSIQNVLIVDDDPLSKDFLVQAIKSIGFNAQSASSGQEALEFLTKREFDLVLTDLRMPGTDGLELVREISRTSPDLPVVLVTAHGTVESAVQAMRFGAADFLIKPVSAETIELVIKRIERHWRLENENAYLRSELSMGGGSQIVAESDAMNQTLEAAGKLASSKGTVLITGESGTGKERVAQFIHENSPRHEGPFIRVNCASLSEQLLESELFGHERGAFTGAYRRRPGRFELADGGTLLLDEIGEITPALQSKLLRVLEEEEFERVGGTTTLRVDVRVIATTNRDLPDEVASGNFREDLYYRLHVLPLHLAPLRERIDDVEHLAYHFANFYAKQNGTATPSFTDEAVSDLLSWNWPGNVRELENVIQRAVVLQTEDVIEPDHLLFGPAGSTASRGNGVILRMTSDTPIRELRTSLANRTIADIEREAILGTLESTGGNKTEAARRLGVTARTISNKMKLWRQRGLVA